MPKMLSEYRILYSIVDNLTGEIIAENCKETVHAKSNVIALAELQFKVARENPERHCMIVVHVLETFWHEL